MLYFASNEDFERAIEYREKLEMLKKLKSRTIASLGAVADLDIFAFMSDGSYSVMAVGILRANKMLGVKTYPIVDASIDEENIYDISGKLVHKKFIKSSIPITSTLGKE